MGIMNVRELLTLDVARYATREICCYNLPTNDLGGARLVRRCYKVAEVVVEDFGIEHAGFSARGLRRYGAGGCLIDKEIGFRGRTAYGLWLLATRPRGGVELAWRFADPGVQRKIARELPAAMAPFTRKEIEDLVETRLRTDVEVGQRGVISLMAARAALGPVTPDIQAVARRLGRAVRRRLRSAREGG